jgi:iron complex outermembrane receptor protein
MHMTSGFVSAAAVCAAVIPMTTLSATSAAQNMPDPTGDIVVALPQGRVPLPLETRHTIAARDIDLIGALAADEILRRLPSVHVPVNSRGEAIAFVRSAAERQVALFYDGAAINVPWDNRLDLSLFPAALAGSAQVAAAPLAPLYGVNALGAVSFSPTRLGGPFARGMIGSGRMREIEAVAPFVTGNTDVLIGGSYATRDGETIADDAQLPYSQVGARRINTDREIASVFGRISPRIDAHRLTLTAFHVDAQKGIAPESDRPTGARLWRYPELEHTLVSANVGLALGSTTALDVIGWYQRFSQTIDSYTDDTYAARDTQEVDRDHTVGARVLLTQHLGPARIVASANVLDSDHDQRDTMFRNGIAPAVLPAFLHYRQRNWSFGLDGTAALTDQLTGEIGFGYDRVSYVETGDKPDIAAAKGWTGRVGLAWSVSDAWRLRAAIGRKIRAPTMRELFGQALNRFLLNPDLQPERIISGEAGAEWRIDSAGASVVGFVQDLDGTIDQRNVGRLRQRINLSGSEVLGIEATAYWHPTPEWTLAGNGTVTRTRRKDTVAGQTDRLAEKPDVLARLYGDYAPASGFGALVELLYTGRAYSADADGVLVALPRSASLNLRLSQRISFGGAAATVFVRADNLFDSRIVPQIGLPAPGRSLRLGVSVGAA